MSSKVRNLKCYIDKQISLPDFLYNFCGVCDSNVFSMTHSDLKKLIPDLERTSYDNVFYNSNMIYDGSILLVRDCKKNVIPYFNPLRTGSYGYEDLPELEKKEKEVITPDEFDVNLLKNYQLRLYYKLQKKSKQPGKYKFCRLIKREMHNRGMEQHGKKRILVSDCRLLDRRREE